MSSTQEFLEVYLLDFFSKTERVLETPERGIYCSGKKSLKVWAEVNEPERLCV